MIEDRKGLQNSVNIKRIQDSEANTKLEWNTRQMTCQSEICLTL